MSQKTCIVKFLDLGLKGLLATMITVSFLATSSFGGEVVVKQMIGEKEYRVEKAEKEKTYWVYFGDEKLLWEPRPSQYKELQDKGPVFYDRWTKPGCLYPLDISLEERAKLNGSQIYRRYMDLEDTAQMLDWKGGFMFDIIDKAGGIRRRVCLEWKRHYQRWPEIYAKENKMINKRYILVTYPDDIRGLATLTKVYDDPNKEQDSWLYLPSVRRIRRMSTSAKEDFAFGMPIRNEDFPIMDPFLHKYNNGGIELFKDPGPKTWGFGSSQWEVLDPNQKGIGTADPRQEGIGTPAWRLECTRGPSKWWFAKKIMHIGVKDLNNYLEEAYDDKGTLIRTAIFGFRPGNICYPEANPEYLLWNMWGADDLRTGYKTMIWGAMRRDDSAHQECFFDSKFDEGIFQPEMLLREYTSTKQY